MKKYIALLFLIISFPSNAEEYICNYSWIGKKPSYSILIDVQGKKAITHGGVLSLEFTVAANTSSELLIYMLFTKENSGPDYPVGFSTMALDKKTKLFVYSNTFAGGNQNNHAIGKCEVVIRDGK